MEPGVPGRSRTADVAAARCSDTAMEPRVPDMSCTARRGDQHQVRCCKLRVVRRGRHGLGAERDQRCQRSTSREKTGGPKHPVSPPNGKRTIVVDTGLVLKGSPRWNALPACLPIEVRHGRELAGHGSSGSIFRDGWEAAATRSATLHSVRAGMIVADSARDYDPPI
jgi:hypothetical protein